MTQVGLGSHCRRDSNLARKIILRTPPTGRQGAPAGGQLPPVIPESGVRRSREIAPSPTGGSRPEAVTGPSRSRSGHHRRHTRTMKVTRITLVTRQPRLFSRRPGRAAWAERLRHISPRGPCSGPPAREQQIRVQTEIRPRRTYIYVCRPGTHSRPQPGAWPSLRRPPPRATPGVPARAPPAAACRPGPGSRAPRSEQPVAARASRLATPP
jgi:hypothetical protein